MAEELKVVVTADTRNYLRGMNKVQRSSKQARDELGRFTKQGKSGMGGLTTSAKVAAAAVGAMALVIGKKAVAAAVAFEYEMAKARTMFRGAEEDFQKMTEAAVAQSKAWGVPAVQEAVAVYDIFSGVTKDVTGAQKFLIASNELATAGFDELATSNKTLITTMNALELPMDRAREIAAKLWATTDVGVIRLGELNMVTGRLSGSMGIVPFEEVMGLIGILTKKLGSAAEATTGLKAIMDVLTKTEGVVVTTAKEHGIVLGPLAVKQQGLIGILGKLVDLGERDIDALRGVVRETSAWNAMLGLLGGGLTVAKENVEGIESAVENYSRAIDINMATTKKQMDIFKTEVNDTMRDLGEAIIPTLIESMKALGPSIEAVGQKIKDNEDVWVDMAEGLGIAVEGAVSLFEWLGKVGERLGVIAAKVHIARLAPITPVGMEIRGRAAARGIVAGEIGEPITINMGATYVQTKDPRERLEEGAFSERVAS